MCPIQATIPCEFHVFFIDHAMQRALETRTILVELKKSSIPTPSGRDTCLTGQWQGMTRHKAPVYKWVMPVVACGP
jgi:hypothetical protein